MKRKNIIIIGGGASGMLCALQLAAIQNYKVILLERSERLGRKLSATGNGQGNVTNANLSVAHYFTDDKSAVERVLNGFDDKALLSYLEGLGGLFEADARGRVYPTGKQASAVTDLLRFALARAGVEVVTGCTVTGVAYQKGEYALSTAEGKTFTSHILVLAMGGKAAKNFGTDGTGYALAKSLGHSVTPLYPALVQIKTDTAHIKSLKGIRADCVVRAYDNGKELTHARGDVIFTDYGVSGNAIFQVSSYLTDAKNPEIALEFLPDTDEEKLTSFLSNKAQFCQKEELLGCVLNNQIGRALLRRLQAEKGGVSVKEAVRLIKKFTLRVTGTLGFDYAQVTRGGIPMSEVNEYLMSKKSPNLYFCGEILNVDGECGGYNLQWAFSSAFRVAQGVLNGAKEGE